MRFTPWFALCLALSTCNDADRVARSARTGTSPALLQPIPCEDACREELHAALSACGHANGECNSRCNPRCAKICPERPQCMGRCESSCSASCRMRHEDCRNDARQGFRECLADCAEPTCPPGLTDCDGSCVDVGSDVENCGACGEACDLPNAVPVCRAGQCQVGQCATQFGDCDGDPANGCETMGPCPPPDAGTSGCRTNEDCDDQDPCTEDFCRYQGMGLFDCEYEPFCDDQNPCTIDECTPSPGVTPECNYRERSCEDQNPCTTDTCNPQTGECEYGDACDDGDPCTRDWCDPWTGGDPCHHEPITPCP